MFKKPFSFKGRISRTEFQFSILIFIVAIAIYGGFMSFLGKINEEDLTLGINVVIVVVFMWAVFFFILAQGIKRCHDVGNPGYWVLIPLYALWLLIEGGEEGINKYGENPL